MGDVLGRDMTIQAHDVLVRNAKRALENLSKDNSVEIKEVLASLDDMRLFLEGLLESTLDEMESGWVDDNIPEESKYDFDDKDYR